MREATSAKHRCTCCRCAHVVWWCFSSDNTWCGVFYNKAVVISLLVMPAFARQSCVKRHQQSTGANVVGVCTWCGDCFLLIMQLCFGYF